MGTDMQDFKYEPSEVETSSDSFHQSSNGNNGSNNNDVDNGNGHPVQETTRARVPLSKREMQIARMIGAGKTVGHIAVELGLSVKTVSTYRVRALQKLGLESNADLIRYIITQHLDDHEETPRQPVEESPVQPENDMVAVGSAERSEY